MTALATVEIVEKVRDEPDICDDVYAQPLGSELYLCHTGPKVLNLQKALRSLGYTVELTSRYDKATRAQVVAFQSGNPPLIIDGQAGPNTQRALEDALAAQSSDRATSTTL